MSLTPNQERFFDLIQTSSVTETVMQFFDVKAGGLKKEMIENQIGVLSHGEQLMVRFFANLWLNENKYEFDLFDAASTLDESNRTLISEWFEDPFWP